MDPNCPVEGCEGEVTPSFATAARPYKVALVGEAPGEDEVSSGHPFTGRAGFKLNRLIEWAGLDRSGFDVWNVCWCRPPNNKLEGTPYEQMAINHWRPRWEPLIDRVNVVVPMGNVPMSALLGQKGILKARGYIYPSKEKWVHILPTVHPAFILRGQSKYSAAFIHDLQRAVELSERGLISEPVEYTLDPSPAEAYEWAKQYATALQLSTVSGNTSDADDIYLAYDIETPGKGDDEGELDTDDPTYFIWRIGFSYKPLGALSIPWQPAYIPAIRLLLESTGPKVVWNQEFDNPRIRHNGVEINGVIHDGMVAWHILHSDLPKGLGFVATFTCPNQPAWKHLSKQSPAFYNATDADVELRSFLAIQKELRQTGLWDVYQRDVLDLEPLLTYMSRVGMPLDSEVRMDRAIKLRDRLLVTKDSMEQCVPFEARRIDHIYVNTPKDITGLRSRPGHRDIAHCATCGLAKPRKDHFKTFTKKVNPCAGGHAEQVSVEVEEYYRLSDFTPSRDQLVRYHQFLGRPLPNKWDKKEQKRKISFDEKALKSLQIKYPDDILYRTILSYREMDKVAGTYIGRPVDDTQQTSL